MEFSKTKNRLHMVNNDWIASSEHFKTWTWEISWCPYIILSIYMVKHKALQSKTTCKKVKVKVKTKSKRSREEASTCLSTRIMFSVKKANQIILAGKLRTILAQWRLKNLFVNNLSAKCNSKFKIRTTPILSYESFFKKCL